MQFTADEIAQLRDLAEACSGEAEWSERQAVPTPVGSDERRLFGVNAMACRRRARLLSSLADRMAADVSVTVGPRKIEDPKAPMELAIGDVVQIHPRDPYMGACFMVVTRGDGGNVGGYLPVPGQPGTVAEYEVPGAAVVRVGQAGWVSTEETDPQGLLQGTGVILPS